AERQGDAVVPAARNHGAVKRVRFQTALGSAAFDSQRVLRGLLVPRAQRVLPRAHVLPVARVHRFLLGLGVTERSYKLRAPGGLTLSPGMLPRLPDEGESMDALSELLRVIRLTGTAFIDAELKAPWAVRTPPPEAIAARLAPGAGRIIPYHVVTEGACQVEVAGQ